MTQLDRQLRLSKWANSEEKKHVLQSSGKKLQILLIIPGIKAQFLIKILTFFFEKKVFLVLEGIERDFKKPAFLWVMWGQFLFIIFHARSASDIQ